MIREFFFLILCMTLESKVKGKMLKFWLYDL